jgi:AmmeMemoRadiSam system protein B/AmmeMemoRadiSam system protein A
MVGCALFAALLIVTLVYHAQQGEEKNDTGEEATYEPRIREPAVAGYFYPENPGELRRAVEEYLDGAEEASCPAEAIGGLIVPHAGYVYSGQVAAWAYRQLVGRSNLTVILIGPSHYHAVEKASVYPCGWYRTPLGDVEVDSELALCLIRGSPDIEYDPEAHEQEHSLEVQLPFLQGMLDEFRIVVMTINRQDPQLWSRVAEAIVACCRERDVLLVASSDLSHYHPRSAASVLDGRVVHSVDAFDPVGLQLKVRSGACELCGLAAVGTVMMACDRMGYDGSLILRYGDSGDASGDTSAVVGYLSAAFHRDAWGRELDAESGGELVALARSSIAHYLETGDALTYHVTDPLLAEPSGAFVTLKKDGDLRGCIGFTLPDLALWDSVARAAVQAACHDPRFTPLSLEELGVVEIEVSVLSRLRVVAGPEEIQVGRDGLYVLGAGRSGLLLPQAPVENGWDRDRFLEEVCRKAGLTPDGLWSYELYAFTAQVFRE